MTLALSSSAFKAGAPIPRRYSGEGEDLSPPLAWSGVPAGAKELALICDDPDAPTPEPWIHWVLYGLPTVLKELKEGSAFGMQGPNDSGGSGYAGPMPPAGHGVHRYFFRLYAIDKLMDAEPGWTKDKLLSEIKGHVLEQAELMGTYERK